MCDCRMFVSKLITLATTEIWTETRELKFTKKKIKMLTRLGLCNVCEICNKPLEWGDGNLICHKYKNTLCFWFADTVDPGE